MDDALGVRVRERLGDRLGQRADAIPRQRAAAQQRAEHAAGAVLLHEVGPLGGVVELEHLDDVRVPQPAHRRRLATEALAPDLGLRDPRVQQLDGDHAVESLVDGTPHLARATRADAVLEPVAAVDLHGRNVA